MNKHFSCKRERIWTSPELLHKAKMEPILKSLIIVPQRVEGGCSSTKCPVGLCYNAQRSLQRTGHPEAVMVRVSI